MGVFGEVAACEGFFGAEGFFYAVDVACEGEGLGKCVSGTGFGIWGGIGVLAELTVSR